MPAILIRAWRASPSTTFAGKKRGVKALWRDFFLNTSHWWDHRQEKINPRFPDFKHKDTQESLWLADARNPPWVQAELAAIPAGTLQSNVFAWAQMLKRYVKAGQYSKTMEVFHQMEKQRLCPDTWTFLPVLKACAALGDLGEGKRVHRQIIRVGCESNVYVATCLVDMFAKCGSIEDACIVFNKMHEHNVVTWSAMIGGYVKAGQELKAIELYCEMQQEGVEPDAVTFMGVLNACAGVAALSEGRHIHEEIIEKGWESNVYVATCLVNMYARCGSVDDALRVFNKMRERNVVTWTAMIQGYAKTGQGWKAMELFWKMEQEGVEPDTVTFVGVLNACASVEALEEGKRVHIQVIQRGYESDLYVANCLVDMYSKCKSMEDAWTVFNRMQKHNVVTWNAIIGGFVNSGHALKAMELFWRMEEEKVDPNMATFTRVLNACASVANLEQGRHVHELIIRKDCQSDVFVGNCLVGMYAKCGSIDDAWHVFNKMPEHNVVTWNAMISCYGKSGHGLKALELFGKMQHEGVEPDAITFIAALNACASAMALEEGRHIHRQIIRRGWGSDIYMANCLVNMYAKCGSLDEAWRVFNTMQERDVVTWSAMIGGYAKSGHGLKAIQLFEKMQEDVVEPDAVTFIAMLNACASIGAIEEGRCTHVHIVERGYQSDVHVANCLVDMYAKCGFIDDAWSVFIKMQEHNVVSWNAMIGCYVMSGQGSKVMELFQKMQQQGIKPDAVTFVGVLNACASVGALKNGRRIHEQIIQGGWQSECYVANCLVHMYAECGSIEDAWIVFKKMPEHDVVSWDAMIGAYVKSGQGLKAMELFREMQQEQVEPDPVTFIRVLNACASVAALEQGRWVHEQIIGRGCEPNVYIGSALIDMYAKCGSIEDAWGLFKKMEEHDVVTWSAMIGGYVKAGQGLKALELFRQMERAGVEPDTLTFVEVLDACASIGALHEGRHIHEQIIQRGCGYDVYVGIGLVVMYAKCGCIEDAQTVFEKIPTRDGASWTAMIGAYAMHGYAKKAIGLFEQMGKEGIEINGITFTCLLSACSHGGLVKEGLHYFELMSSCYHILPTGEHHACMVDLLGRAGFLVEAEELTKRMPSKPDVCLWMSLLGACRIHGNIEMGERAAKQCWELDPENASGHLLLSNIYAAA